jgi:ATP-dependent Lon protease
MGGILMDLPNEKPDDYQSLDWNKRLSVIYPGAVVNKSIGLRHDISQLPRFVSEWLIGKFCETGETHENLAEMDTYVRSHFIERKQKYIALHQLEQQGEIKLIDAFKVTVDLAKSEEERYSLEIPTLSMFNANILRPLIDEHPRMLVDGVWGLGNLIYKSETGEIVLTQFRPFQLSNVDLSIFQEGRSYFSTEEWQKVLVSSTGLNPDAYSPINRLHVISRMVPLVENNTHIIELGPPGTGKTYLYDKVSAYSRVISGSVVSPAVLFYNIKDRTSGLLAYYDVVVFDEIDKVGRGLKDEVVNKLLKFMADASYDRGEVEIPSTASVVLVGNLPAQNQDYDTIPCFGLLPVSMQHKAFLDRLAGFIPGWEIGKIGKRQEHLTPYNGFAADYFCEILHLLRGLNYQNYIDQYVELINANIRDEKGIKAITSGLLKLLFPDGSFKQEDVKTCVEQAIKYRQRVLNHRYLLYRDPADKKVIELRTKQ